MKYFAAVLAGGTGTRFGSATPKQFLMLGDKPIFVHSIEKFLSHKEIELLVLGVHPDWIETAQRQIDEYIEDASKIRIAPGGADRESTLLNVIAAMQAEYDIEDDDVIITHDSVRPYVTNRLISDMIEKMKHCDACNTLVRPVDTISQSLDGEVVDNVPDRSTMYCGQSPQGFKINMLLRAFESLTDEERAVLTETSKVCFLRNIPVHFIMGDPHNFKITTEYDYEVAKFILEFVKKKD